MINQMVFLVYLLLFTNQLIHSNGHGMMCHPRQRGAYISEQKCGSNVPIGFDSPVVDFCAHCLNGGTVATVKANLPSHGWTIYDPLSDVSILRCAGLCGDPRGRVDHMIGGDFVPYDTVPIVNVSQSGGTFDFMAEIDTNHNGYFEFFLCDLDACGAAGIAEKCFSEGHCHRLNPIPHPICEDTSINTDYECGPIDSVYPSRWYLPCRNTGHVGIHLVGGPSGTMRYELPKEIRQCKHCVVQWYWATANSCNPRGVKEYFETYGRPFGTTCESDGGGLGAHNPRLAPCGGDAVPEEFWSCADIQISADGQPLGVVQARANPSPGPDKESNDDVVAKEDTEEAIEEGQKQLEEDIEEEASETKREEKKEEKKAELGVCLLENEPCDATVPCCDTKQVCVYTIHAGMFTCRFWWGLWKEVNDQEKLRSGLSV